MSIVKNEMFDPVIVAVNDEKSFEYYSSKFHAQMSMEPIDVRNGLYEVFDLHGNLLRLSVETCRQNRWWDIFSTPIESTRIDLTITEKFDMGVLKKRCLTYIKECHKLTQVKQPLSEDSKFKDFVSILKQLSCDSWHEKDQERGD